MLQILLALIFVVYLALQFIVVIVRYFGGDKIKCTSVSAVLSVLMLTATVVISLVGIIIAFAAQDNSTMLGISGDYVCCNCICMLPILIVIPLVHWRVKGYQNRTPATPPATPVAPTVPAPTPPAAPTVPTPPATPTP